MKSCKERLIDYFVTNGTPFETIRHHMAYTAQEEAAEVGVPGRMVAKVVMVVADGKLTMLVLPATLDVDLERARLVLHAQELHLAKEKEFAELFPDCDVGAMPPFGNLYDLAVYVDRALAQESQIVFDAGTHGEAIRLNYQDYARLVNPRVARFGTHLRQFA